MNLRDENGIWMGSPEDVALLELIASEADEQGESNG